jgi:CHAT domain-containing protein
MRNRIAAIALAAISLFPTHQAATGQTLRYPAYSGLKKELQLSDKSNLSTIKSNNSLCDSAQTLKLDPKVEKNRSALIDCFTKIEEVAANAYKAEDWPRLIMAATQMIELKRHARGEGEINEQPAAGIGAILETDDTTKMPKVLETAKGSPAAKAKIITGDLITEVNSRATSNLHLDEVIRLIRGKVDSYVTIATLRGGKPFRSRIKRTLLRGQDLSPYLREYSSLYVAYAKSNRIKEALELFGTVEKAALDKEGTNSLTLADLYIDHAFFLWKSNDLRTSRSYLQKAAAIYNKLDTAEKFPQLLKINNRLSSIALELGDIRNLTSSVKEAIRVYEQSHAIEKQEARELVLRIQAFAGICHYSSMALSRCMELTEKGSRISHKYLEESDIAHHLMLQAYAIQVANIQGREKSIGIFKEVIRLQEKYTPADAEARILAVGNLVPVLALEGRPEEAGEQWRNLLTGIQITHGPRSNEVISARIQAGSFYATSSLFSQAYEAFASAYQDLARTERADIQTDALRIKLIVEHINAIIADLPIDKARISKLAIQAEKITKKYPDDISAKLSILGIQANVALVAKDYATAARRLREFIRHLNKIKKDSIPRAKAITEYQTLLTHAEASERIALIEAVRGNYGDAISTMKNAIATRKRLSKSGASLLPGSLLYLAQLQFANHALDDARASVQMALSASRSNRAQSLSSDEAQAAAILGGIAALQGRDLQAEQYFRKSLEDSTRASLVELGSSSPELRAELASRKNGLDFFFYPFKDAQPYHRSALMAALNLVGLASEIERAQRHQETDKRTIEYISKGAGLTEIDFRQSSLAPSNTDNITNEDPNKKDGIVSTAEVAAALPSKSILIAYRKYSAAPLKIFNKENVYERYLALILEPSGRVQRYDLGPATSIDTAIAKTVESSSQNLEGSLALWDDLAQKIIEPLLPVIQKNRFAYVLADSELSRVPFGALRTGKKEYLSELVEIRHITSGQNLIRLSKVSDEKVSDPVVVADPLYGSDSEYHKASGTAYPKREGESGTTSGQEFWQQLPATAQEGSSIATLMRARLLTGKDASEDAIRRIQSPRLIHIASHGYFWKDVNPKVRAASALSSGVTEQYPVQKSSATQIPRNILERSGVVLAGVNRNQSDPRNDGYLTSKEISSLDWKGTELVVLSACETGVGSITPGEGVFGLRRSIEIAGARSSLLSLWKVDDDATAAFMNEFYKRIKNGEGRLNALTATQKEFRDNPQKPEWIHPYYWAAFQLNGDWRQIKGL